MDDIYYLMSNFLHKFNTDDVHSRAVIIGLINVLNSRVQYTNVLSDTQEDTVTVPFFYSMTGDDRFLQDYFLEWNDCIHPKIADGNYDVIPRGIVTLSSSSINTAAMTHRFVRAKYVKEVNGELQTYNSFLNSIPLSMNFDVVIAVDTNLDAFKIQQAILETFYKTQVYSINFKGFRVPCQAGFPEDYAFEKTFEFTYEAENRISIKFSIALETYYPVTDATTTRLNSNRMSGIGVGAAGSHSNGRATRITAGGTGADGGIEYDLHVINDRDPASFNFTQPIPNSKYFSGSIMPIQWSSEGSVLRVNLYYRLPGEDWRFIARDVPNSGSYDWTVPFFDTDFKSSTNDPLRVNISTNGGRDAVVRAIADEGGLINQLIVINEGYSYSGNDTIQVSPLITSTYSQSVTGPNITASVVDGRIVGSQIHNPGSGFTPSPDNFIEIKIEHAANPEISQIYQKSQAFKGNTDPFIPESIRKITNLSPTINEIIANGVDILTTISGPGLQNGSNIISANAINNTVTLDRDVTLLITGGVYTLGNSNAIFEIQ